MLSYAFGALNFHRVSLRVVAVNARAIRAYEKVGCVREGIERQSARVGDTWHDDVMMGPLAAEFGDLSPQRHHVSPPKARIAGVRDN
jgi:RimJ/RimL family protein N-acetyltransferase